MPRVNPHRPFTPDPQQMALQPDVSGNVINGLGEIEPRRPSIVYWAPDPDNIPHGDMQNWFFTVDPGLPVFAEMRAKRQEVSQRPLPAVAALTATGLSLQIRLHVWARLRWPRTKTLPCLLVRGLPLGL